MALFTAPASQAQSEVAVDIGSFGLRQLRLGMATPLAQGFELRASASQTELDGFRPHSAADRRLANVRLGWKGSADTVTLLLSDHRQNADDPLGLDRAQFNANARQTTPQALEYNTRKTVSQTQLGLNWKHRFGDGALRASEFTAYGGGRSVLGYLAVPAIAQRPASSGGGVVDFDREYQGVDAKLLWRLGPGELITGAAFETQRDDRRGWQNFSGNATAPTNKGRISLLRRDEINTAETRELYAQALWPLASDVALTAGVRGGEARLRAEDRYLSNGNDSGGFNYRYTNPVLGLHWQLQPGWALHASVARGFESPTLGEVAYAPTTQTGGGFNKSLAGQTSRQTELGSKWRMAQGSLDATLFTADTDNEIGVQSNSGGRSVFQNVGRTHRHGLELAGA